MSESAKLATIKALLAKAEASEFDGEAETLREKAFELLAKYGLEEALAASEAPVVVEPVKEFVTLEGNYHNRRVMLLDGIAKAMRCEAIMLTTRLKKGQKNKSTLLLIYGMPSDVERVKLMWGSLELQLASELNRSLVHKPVGVHGRTWSVNFINAYAYKVVQRVRAIENQAEAEEVQFGDSRTALVLVDNKKKVQALYDSENKDARSVNYAGTASSAGWDRGASAGERARLGSGSGSVGGSGRQALNR